MKKIIMMLLVLVSVLGLGITAGAAPKNDTSAEESVSVEQESVITELKELIGKMDSAEGENEEVIEELIAFVKAKLAAGELESEEDIQDAIAEGEEKFQVTLSEDEKQMILEVMNKIKELGLDPEKLLDQAKDLYSQYGDALIDNASEKIKNSFTDSVKQYFSDFTTTVKDFFTGFFS